MGLLTDGEVNTLENHINLINHAIGRFLEFEFYADRERSQGRPDQGFLDNVV
jgi:hypothetical protein